MARGSEAANTGANTGNQFAQTYGGNANTIFSGLSPMLMNEARNPQGMSPKDLAETNTSNMQSAGGSEAAAVGGGLLRAARTGNAGGSEAAMESGVRHSGEQLSNAGLQTRLKNAMLKQQQKSEATRGLEGLYGTSVSGGNQALGEVASNVRANTDAENSSWNWARFLLDPAMAAAGGSAGWK